MSVTKRGLLAPQNTFLENICRKATSQNSHFIIANGRIVNYPVVYCTEAFARLFGYDRAEIMLKSACCSFLFGEMTDDKATTRLNAIFESQTKDSVELLLYKRNRSPVWILYYISPIYNEREKVVLFVCTAKDITSVKLLENEDITKGLGRFARLARTVTRKTPSGLSSFTPDSSMNSAAPSPSFGTTTGGNQNDLSHSLNNNHNHSNYSSSQLSNSASFNKPSNQKWKRMATFSSRSRSISQEKTFTSQLEEIEYPRYMLEAPKTPPYTILHTSTFKQTWDWVLFMLTVYTAIMVPFEIVYEVAQEDVFVGIIDLCVDTAFIIDIVISFRTTYVHIGGEVVSDSKRIRNNYIKGWFALDLISSVPLEMIDMIIEQIDTNEKAIFTQLRLIKLVRLLRLVRVIRRLDHYMEYAGGQLLMFLSIFLLFAHWFALVWYSIGISEQHLEYNWINEMRDLTMPGGNQSRWDGSASLNSSIVFTSYVSSLYFTMSSMTSIGFGNIAGNTNSEKIFCIILMFVGSLLYATIFGNVTTMFQQMSSQSTRYHEMLNDIREFMKLYQVPKDLAERVMDYVVSTWAMTKGVNTDKVMNYTPKDMRADLSIHLNRHILREHPAFRLASEGCLRALAINFEMHHSAPGDLLFHTGESIEELCFIASGSLEVIQDDEVVAILGKGDVIGDKFWLESNVGQSAVNVRALTYTDLHIISREALVEILRFYESFATSFSRNLVLAFNLRHRVRFKTIADLRKEQEMAARKETAVDLPADHPVRKLFSRFRGKVPNEDSINILPSATPSPTPTSASDVGGHGHTSSERHIPKQNGALPSVNHKISDSRRPSLASALKKRDNKSHSIGHSSHLLTASNNSSIFKVIPSQRKISGSKLHAEENSSPVNHLSKNKKKSMWDKIANKRESSLDTDDEKSATLTKSGNAGKVASSSGQKTVRIGGEEEISAEIITYNPRNLQEKLKSFGECDPLVKSLLDIRSDMIMEALSMQTKLKKLDDQIMQVADNIRSAKRQLRVNLNLGQSQKPNETITAQATVESAPDGDEVLLSRDSIVPNEVLNQSKSSNLSQDSSSSERKSAKKVLVKQKVETESPKVPRASDQNDQVENGDETWHGTGSNRPPEPMKPVQLSIPQDTLSGSSQHETEDQFEDRKFGDVIFTPSELRPATESGENPSRVNEPRTDSPSNLFSIEETSFSFIDVEEKPVTLSKIPEF
ncbi:potassium voltage-gated channel subfamily H member 5-like isoform X3 [Symsagittifera roscoffensis]|uniref:potassium voltage-gated channel subfamily H member 5-like isoform X3 n=1 Tax=Symsagittifera roscoffensis TaxID=84072 RepID=UPI00307C46E6